MNFRKATQSFFKELRSGTPSTGLSLTAFLSWAMSGGEPTASGEVINHATALQNITVQACVRVLSDGVSSLPCNLYQKDGTGRKQLFTPLSRILSVAPNEEMTAITFWACLTSCLALTGNCYAEIERNGAGQPVALWPLNPNLTHARRDVQTNTLFYETTDGMGMGNSTPRKIDSANMYHVPLFSWDGVEGFSPITLARQGIGLARAAELMGARLFGNGSKPGGLLTPTDPNISPEAMEAARRTWMETQSGAKQGSTAVLSGDWKYTPLAINPADSQFLETRKFQREEIAALFGVPVSRVGSTGTATKISSEAEALSFLGDTLRPYLSRMEAEAKRKLISDADCFAEFDVTERLRTDFATSMTGYATAKQWGFMNTNMILEDQGKNPIGPVGDVFYCPVNMMNAELLLNTESIQVQPLDVTPAAAFTNPHMQLQKPQPPNTIEGQKELPAPAEIKALGKYTVAFIHQFRDGFQRLAKRSKRDTETVQQILGPVLRSITDLSLSDALEKHGLDKVTDELDTTDIVNTTCRSICKRMEGIDGSNFEEAAQKEFIKSLRAVFINVNKEIAAAVADLQLQEDTDAE